MFASKQALYVLILQTALMQFLVASPSLSQSIEKVKVSIEVKNVPLEEVFSAIESQTDYVFVYNNEVRTTNTRISLKMAETTVADVLRWIANKENLKFQQINDNITVAKVQSGGADGMVIEPLPVPDITIMGNVKDDNQQPLPGVNVMVKGTAIGVVTDIDGNYVLNVPDDAGVLVFSYIGYLTEEIKLTGQNTIDMILYPDITRLNEVIITALGFEEDKDKVGYASSSIEGPSVENAGERNLINGMEGRASGLRITRSSGDPGAGSHIQIRGANSLIRDIQPLVILDGIPISNATVGSSVRGTVQQSRLNDINPNDIASIEVLKGASAAALWGTRAANGVLVIKTKNGARNNKNLNISLTSTYSIDKINAKFNLQDKFGQGIGGEFVENNPRSWGDKISERPGGTDVFTTDGPFFVAEDGDTYYPIAEKAVTADFSG